MAREKIVEKLQERHNDSTYVYTSCTQNGCWDSSCILRCQVKDGKIVSFEPDDSVNPGNAREDIGEDGLKQGMVQMRPCVMGHAWKKELDSPTRINNNKQGQKNHDINRMGQRKTCPLNSQHDLGQRSRLRNKSNRKKGNKNSRLDQG